MTCLRCGGKVRVCIHLLKIIFVNYFKFDNLLKLASMLISQTAAVNFLKCLGGIFTLE